MNRATSERPGRVVMCVDMDAFYAAVEMRRNPAWRDLPMWVGGATRGVVLSANYPARAYGVRGGMSSVQARRLCPTAVCAPPDFDTYADVSAGIVAVLESFTARVEYASIDEAYLELTGSERTLGPAASVGQQLRAIVHDEQRIACSVGIGPNRLVAKMASNSAKPDGLLEVLPEAVVSFLHPQPVENLFGVGESTAARLRPLGVATIADLAELPRSELQREFGLRAGALLHDAAWGRDHTRVVARPGERGVGCQETFNRDLLADREIVAELLRVVVKVASRMRAAGVLGRTLTLKLRYADFQTVSRAVTLSAPTDLTDELYAAARRLYAQLRAPRRRVRRVGVRVTSLARKERVYLQPTLDAPERGWREAERAADAVIERFGPQAVHRAALTKTRRP